MKMALVIIYNHKFERNIDKVEKVYSNRFKYIFHLMPFYEGNKSNVIPVYESSYYFQGYIAQGYRDFYNEEFERYLFLGDDVLLNPEINEDNLDEYFKTNIETCFVPHAYAFGRNMGNWNRNKDALAFRYYENSDSKYGGVEAISELPSSNDAKSKLEQQGFKVESLLFEQLYGKLTLKNLKGWSNIYRKIIHTIKNRTYALQYPLIGSYSDIFVLNRKSIPKFSHYCGVFAACDLHVEIAIPTAIALASDKIAMEEDWKGLTMWNDAETKWLEKFNYSLDSLYSEFPKNTLYIHPIKLSKWN